MSIQELIDLINNGAPIDEIKCLIESDIDTNEPVGGMGLCALHHAVYKNRPECVRYLVEHGGNINAKDQCGFTPIHVAARYNRVDVMKELIHLGANMEEGDEIGCPPLNLALQKGYEACAEALLSNGANSNRHYKHVGYEIHQLPSDTPKCLELLLQYGADPELRNARGMTALQIAIKMGNILYVYILLQHNANTNAICAAPTSQNKWPALHLAVIGGEKGITELLLLYGADPNIKDTCGNSAMHHVAAHGHVEIAQLLIIHGAHVVLNNERNYQPLHRACASSTDPKMIMLLLENGAETNARTVLMENPMQLLLRHIASLSVASPDGQEMVLMLLDYGARITLTTDSSEVSNILSILSPLSVNHLALIKVLLEAADKVYIPQEDQDVLQDLGGRLREFILMMSSCTRTLKHIARKEVRHYLGNICSRRLVDQLEIPKSLKDYILYQ